MSRLSPVSSAWAVNAVLRMRELEDIAESTIFGLGASAWYRLEATDAGAVLRGQHPERIKQSFYALNVYVVRYDYLSSDVMVQLRQRTRQSVSTIVTLDRRALPAAFGGGPDTAGPGPDHDYAMLVHRDQEGTDDDLFWLQGPDDAEPRAIGAAALLHAWRRPVAGGAVATFYQHPVMHLHWRPEPAMTAALRRHCSQMRHHYPTLGPTGLQALRTVAGQLREGDGAALLAAARCAATDGGPGMCRDVMARFVRDAARVLALPALEAAAAEFDACAAAWGALLRRALDGAPPQSMASGIDAILAHEGAAVAVIEQALASLAAHAHHPDQATPPTQPTQASEPAEVVCEN